ncbi:leukocyte immunoglobulin-like receptor subfamily A member 3 [Tenrec ecaudatus]|uniref:leukocyte immunoglobulin-like receptor subfamily A member 3 n=1 Tax=Tenrec ecaudatus TaxID=94439 RepID=UPI003F59A9AC
MALHKRADFPGTGTQAVFPVDPMNPSSGGTYRCYGSYSNYPNVWSQPSNPVDLMVSGVHRKPSLTASPHSPVMAGDNLTLQCRSDDGFDKFALARDWPSSDLQLLPVQTSPNFTLTPVFSEHGGQYRCYGGYGLSYEWSAPSEPLDILVAASDDKPSLSAHPGPLVSPGQKVTLQCRSSHWYDTVYWFKEDINNPPQPIHPESPTGSSQADFTMSPATSAHEGTYRCYTARSKYLLSQPSEPLELVLSGEYHPPQLSIQPSPLVASGKKVSLTCSSTDTFHTFHLLKEGTDHMARQKGTQFSNSLTQAVFLVDPVSPSSGGTYRCYGSYSNYPNVWSQPSNPVDLMVSGVHRKPSLTASPHSPVMAGTNLTLQCHSDDGFDKFALTRDWPSSGLQLLPVQPTPNFTLTPVFSKLWGQYRCYGGYSLSYEWSAPSEPVDILVAASDDKPSLSAHPGPSVAPGEGVTLQCRSSHWFDTVYWFKEDINHPPQPVHSDSSTGSFQADFTMSPATSAHEGTYRCYTAYSKYLLSQPSDPLELVLSGE